MIVGLFIWMVGSLVGWLAIWLFGERRARLSSQHWGISDRALLWGPPSMRSPLKIDDVEM